MKYEEIKSKIENQNIFSIASEKDIPHGKVITLQNGCVISCYTVKGTHHLQGKCIEETKQFLENSCTQNRKIFVVYGHDDLARIQLEALLRRWDLDPIILCQQASSGQTIIEKLEECSNDVGFAIVLATPDDEGKAKTENDYKLRVRQNVVLELGMCLAKLGREKVAILLKESINFEKPSDIHGVVYIPFKDSVEEASLSLIRELSRQNYHIDQNKI